MSADNSPQAPIYDALIQEHGDVPAETREVAEEAQREVSQTLDFSRPRRPGATGG